MGKHNGKARKVGLPVGSALVRKAKREGRTGPGGAASFLHTTDVDGNKKNNMQSVIESNDLEEMMNLADLADRDFTAEKSNVVVISTGAVEALDEERATQARREAESRHAHRLRIPRRPPWDASTSPEELDVRERTAFLDWRRDLASLESEEHLVLTPFEKNLEVWRQLWRVVERSDIVVQVLDARDPLTYYSQDLEIYCREVHPEKKSFLLLNKSDLLPRALRLAWADYFDARGLAFAFWSAKSASETDQDDEQAQGQDKPFHKADAKRERARILSVNELLFTLEEEARSAVHAAEGKGLERASRGERYVIGLTGYPNVGKSSTINALFGSKKTAVAATPGKTKHFQTLNVSDTLCLCDCPGLVMPQFARSKAEMVAAGVIPIDRLTDVRAPVGEVAAKVSHSQLEKVYGIRLPNALPSMELNADNDHIRNAVRLLRSLALSRGWLGASGHPDETRAGRRILKDFVDGKILTCNPPPGASPKIVAIAKRVGIEGRRDDFEDEDVVKEDLEDGKSFKAGGHEGKEQVIVLDDADLELMESLDIGDGMSRRGPKPVRAAHKFHKKPGGGGKNRSKIQSGNIGLGYGVISTGIPRQVD